MLKQFFTALFSKKTKQVKEKEKESVPTFSIKECPPAISDFVVTELSFEEFTKYKNQERRKTKIFMIRDRRKPENKSQNDAFSTAHKHYR